jgi:hypothetical protein
MKLFAFYVGGETETSNTELHNMRFAVGERMEDCYESLRRQWWGTPESLHSNVFVVAPDKARAKERALATVDHWMKPHRDTLFEVEHIIGLSEVTAPYGLHIHLAPTTNTQPLAFVTGCYIRLGAK